MDEYGVSPSPGTIRFERFFDAPIARVWEYIVDDEKRGRWFCSGPLEQRVGGQLRFTFQHDNLSANGAPYPMAYLATKGMVAEGTVIAIDPPNLLTINWGGEGERTTFALSAVSANRTKLVLTESGLEDVRDNAAGWHAHLAVLADRLQGRLHADFWATHAAAERDYADRFSAPSRDS